MFTIICTKNAFWKPNLAKSLNSPSHACVFDALCETEAIFELAGWIPVNEHNQVFCHWTVGRSAGFAKSENAVLQREKLAAIIFLKSGCCSLLPESSHFLPLICNRRCWPKLHVAVLEMRLIKISRNFFKSLDLKCGTINACRYHPQFAILRLRRMHF